MSNRVFFVMLKPDAIARGLAGEIISRFERKGFSIMSMKMLYPERDVEVASLLKAHYAEFEQKSFYPDMMRFLLNGRLIVLLLVGNIETAREIVGATVPSEARPGSIRGDYASSLPENLIHCSHTPEAAAREVELWSRVFE